MRLLHICLAFIVGNATTLIANYFPVLIICISFLSLTSLVFYFRLKIIPVVLSFILGFVYADFRATPTTPLNELSGKRMALTVSIENTDDKTVIRNVRVISAYDIESGSMVLLDRVNLFLKNEVEPYKEYKVVGNFPREIIYKNPSTILGLPTNLYVEDIEVIKPIEQGLINRMRDSLNSYITEHFQPEPSGFLKAILTGQRDGIDKQMRDAFNKTGLAHILSISGAHFGLFVFMVFKSLNLILRLLPERLLLRLTLHMTTKQVSAILTIPFITFYLLISSMSYPSIRAFIMILFFLFGLLLHRRRYIFHSIIYAGFVIVLFEPSSLRDISFILSFSAVCGIAVALGLQKEDEVSGQYTQNTIQNISRSVQESILICISASVATAPVVAYTFHTLSVISPVTNLIFTPIIGFIILPLTIVSSIIYLLTSYFPLNSLLDSFTSLILKTIISFSHPEWSSLNIPAFPVILIFISYFLMFITIFYVSKYFKQTMRSKMILVCLALFVSITIILKVPFALSDDMRVTFLDVGQGDSSVVEMPDRKVIVIDTGKDGFHVCQYLKYRGIKDISALVISHPQRDHVGGFERLKNDFNIEEIWDNGFVQYLQDSNIKKVSLIRGDVMYGADYKILVLHPHRDFNPNKNIENNLSLVIKICGRLNCFLFTGDIENEAIEDINHLGSYLSSTVLKIPHHGSKSSGDSNFINHVSPGYAVISLGAGNRHGLPHKEVLDLLNDIRVFTTDKDGAIRFSEDNSGRLNIMTYKDFTLKPQPDIKEELANLKRLFYKW